MMLKVKLRTELFQRLKAAVFSLCLPGRGRQLHVGGTPVYSRVSATTIAYKLSFTLLRFSHCDVENNYITFMERVNIIRQCTS